MSNPNIERAARVIAAAFVHGTSSDIAAEVAQALDDARLLVDQTDPFRAPGRERPAPSPAAVAALDQCGRAKVVADLARKEISEMPGAPQVDAAGGEVTFVVHPSSVDEWNEWLLALGVRDARAIQHTNVSTIARCTYRGVRTRLVGVGVPAMVAAALGAVGASS